MTDKLVYNTGLVKLYRIGNGCKWRLEIQSLEDGRQHTVEFCHDTVIDLKSVCESELQRDNMLHAAHNFCELVGSGKEALRQIVNLIGLSEALDALCDITKNSENTKGTHNTLTKALDQYLKGK